MIQAASACHKRAKCCCRIDLIQTSAYMPSCYESLSSQLLMRIMAHHVASAVQSDHHCLSLEAYFVAYYATVVPCRSESNLLLHEHMHNMNDAFITHLWYLCCKHTNHKPHDNVTFEMSSHCKSVSSWACSKLLAWQSCMCGMMQRKQDDINHRHVSINCKGGNSI